AASAASCAGPVCGSAYHESKWAAEEIVRSSGLNYTVLKSGMIYGRGDHMLDHISHTLHTIPLFAWVGSRERPATRFTQRQIRKHLPEGQPFGRADLRCCADGY